MRLLAVLLAMLVILLPLTWLEAHALTKEDAAKQYAQREQAKIRSGTDVELVGPNLNVITLEISRACKVMNTTKCPKFSDIIAYDTTNQKYVGKLTDEKRLKPFLRNPGIIYKDTKDTVICVDCPFDIYKNSKHIIVGTPFIYKQDSDTSFINNTIKYQVRYEYHNRYVENCANAKITLDLLNDTINYLKSGCKETKYNGKVTILKELTKHDTTTTQVYKYLEWLKEAKKLSQTNCLKSKIC